MNAQQLTKRGRQKILGLIEAAQLAMSQIDLTKERALLNEVVQSIPEGNCHDLRAVFYEEYEAFRSALDKIDALGENKKPPPEIVETNIQFDIQFDILDQIRSS